MKHSLYLIALIFMVTTMPGFGDPVVESPAESLQKGWALGAEASGLPNSYGLGLHMLTPSLFGDNFRIKFGVSHLWTRCRLAGEADQSWVPFSNLRLGVHVSFPIKGSALQGYAEGGVAASIPDSRLSRNSMDMGGYGVFGFEFPMRRTSTSFFEFGGMGVGGRADRVPGRPSYSGGFMAAAGVRYWLN
jgi:hypothetical protein